MFHQSAVGTTNIVELLTISVYVNDTPDSLNLWIDLIQKYLNSFIITITFASPIISSVYNRFVFRFFVVEEYLVNLIAIYIKHND